MIKEQRCELNAGRVIGLLVGSPFKRKLRELLVVFLKNSNGSLCRGGSPQVGGRGDLVVLGCIELGSSE